MSVKSWNDRADRDLFFTILSVKDIGIISATEWSTIGNQMRCMGYGFTNEGCRQHFQGVRRAQSRAEETGYTVFGNPSPYPSPCRDDPTRNPIMRRPGPGRGRPKKHLLASDGQPGPHVMAGPSIMAGPGMLPSPGIAQAMAPAPAPAPEQQGQQMANNVEVAHVAAPSQSHHHAAATHMAACPAIKAEASDAPLRAEHVGDENGGAGAGESQGEGNVGDADAEGVDEPPVKKQRLDDDAPDLEQSAPLDDEAMLALAAHNGESGPQFQGAFPYCDA